MTQTINTENIVEAEGGNDSGILSPGEMGGVFNDYEVECRFENDSHVYMMGITSPNGFQGATVAFAQLASPTLLWIVDWTASQYANPPPIPDPESTDSNWVLIDQHYDVFQIGIDGNGSVPLYRISGTYVYGHQNPDSVPTRDISFPKPPWMKDVFVRTVDDSLLQGGISSSEEGATTLPDQGDSSSETSTTDPPPEVVFNIKKALN